MPSLHPLLSWALVASSSIGLAACGGGGGSGSIQPGVFGTGVATSEAADRFFVQDPGIAPPILEASCGVTSTASNSTEANQLLTLLPQVLLEPSIAARLDGLMFGARRDALTNLNLIDRNGNQVFDLGDSIQQSGTSGSETIDLVGFSSTNTGPAALLRITYANFQATTGGPTLNGIARVFYERTGTDAAATASKLTIGESQYSSTEEQAPTARITRTFKVRRLIYTGGTSPIDSATLFFESPLPPPPGAGTATFGALIVGSGSNFTSGTPSPPRPLPCGQ